MYEVSAILHVYNMHHHTGRQPTICASFRRYIVGNFGLNRERRFQEFPNTAFSKFRSPVSAVSNTGGGGSVRPGGA